MRRAWPLAGALAVAAAAWSTRSLEATAGIDPSWRVALHLAVLRGVDYGGDFAWTYGPLGFLTFPIAVSGWTLVAAFAFVCATQLVLAYLLIRAAGVAGIVLGYLALALPVPPADHLVLIVLALVVLGLRRDARWVYAAAAVAGLAALTKTNTGAVAIVLVVLAAAAVRAWAAPAVSLAVFLVGWLATGNDLTGLPAWLRLSAGLVAGYSPAMQYEQPGLGREYWYAAIALLIFAAGAWAVARRLERRRALALALACALFAFSFFKEGFVRHDAEHSATFFAAIAIGCILVAGARVAAVAAVAFALFTVHQSGALDLAPVASARALVTQAGDVLTPHDLVVSSRAGMRRSYGLPAGILAALRGRTVDVLPYETSVVAAYGLPWRPLPVLQDYSVYTPGIDRANARFLASRRAPERLLRLTTANTVNQRPREVDGPAEQRAIVCDYREVVATQAADVLARSAPHCGPPRSLGVVTAPSGVPVAVPDGGVRDLVVARIHLEDTVADRVRGLLFKPHAVSVSLGGGPFAQLIAATAADGVILHVPGATGLDPRFGGATDWRTFAVGTHTGAARIEFVAYRVTGPVPAARAPLPRKPLAPHPLPAAVGTGGGFVDYAFERRGVLVVQGWAGTDVSASQVLVYADGKLVWASPPNMRRPDVAAALGKPALDRSGYEAAIPIREVRTGATRRHLRVIAIVHGAPLEVTYPASFGWR